MERTALKTTRAKNRSTRTTTEKKAKAAKAKAEPKEVFKVEIGPPKLTRFERARIIGARALQLSLGAPPFMPASPAERDPITLASKELDSKALPISIKRTLPDGRYQDIAVRFLLWADGIPKTPMQPVLETNIYDRHRAFDCSCWKMIVCQRCGKISESMGEAPVMGRIGELVLNNTCKNCWEEWKKTEMITINEYRLDFSMKEHRDFFYSQMKQFLKLPDR